MNNLEKARARMLLKYVFFATPMLSSPMVIVKPDHPQIRTAATDMVKIYLNPAFIEKLDTGGIIFVLAHEVMHMILKHGLRRQHRDPYIFNIACDHVINRILVSSGMPMLKVDGMKFVEDPKGEFKGMSEEQIYDLLIEEQKKKGGRGVPGNDMDGDIMAMPEDLTADQVEQVKRSVEQKIAQAANMARMAGNMPGELEGIINDLLNPQVPWYDLLRDYATRISHDDESWNRRNRRFQTVYLPAMHNMRMAGMTVIGDSSGSINDDDYAKILTETFAIIEDMNPEFIRFVWADMIVQAEEMLHEYDPVELHPKGGGGTDMRVPLEYVQQYDPPVVVLITDGCTPWPEIEPPYPLIVVCTTNAECPVGMVVRV